MKRSSGREMGSTTVRSSPALQPVLTRSTRLSMARTSLPLAGFVLLYGGNMCVLPMTEESVRWRR